jgi:Spy/CpxP family protein refolding chaperone
MRLLCRSWLLAGIVLLALAPTVRGQSFGFPWWRDAQFQRDLSLTSDQTTRIENLFQSTIGALRSKKAELDQQEDELSRLIAANADESAVIKQVDKVEAIRSNLNKMRTLQLLHIRQVLTPDQRTKLNRIHDQWEKDHRRQQPRSNQRK